MSTAEKRDYAREELVEALTNLLKSKTDSDLTITCGGRSFEVHSLIVCCRSDFFRAACKAGFWEAETRTIELKEEDPFMVDRMIKYLYTLDYADACGSVGEDPMTRASDIHVAMYRMGDKFGIWGLKKTAEAKCERAVQSASHMRLLALVPKIYESTPEKDSGLRDVVVRAAGAHISKLPNLPKFKEVVAVVPEFACDLITWASENATMSAGSFLSECRGCHAKTYGKIERLRCRNCSCLKNAPS